MLFIFMVVSEWAQECKTENIDFFGHCKILIYHIFLKRNHLYDINLSIKDISILNQDWMISISKEKVLRILCGYQGLTLYYHMYAMAQKTSMKVKYHCKYWYNNLKQCTIAVLKLYEGKQN